MSINGVMVIMVKMKKMEKKLDYFVSG
jgi:hypothetical protein